jgi:hypothetical protein
MIEKLAAAGPAPDRAPQMMLYGQFVGSWEGTLVVPDGAGGHRERSSEVHFGWVLEGRAIQDVWIVPSRRARRPDEADAMYGTTLRVYDPRRDVWTITWIDPVRQAFDRMEGRKVGDDIVQEYRNDAGARCEWRFSEITADSFRWTARESQDGGATWNTTGEFFLRRATRAD